MNPPTILQSQAPNRARRHLGLGLALAAAVVVAAVALAGIGGLDAGRPTVPTVTYENPTDYALFVTVSPGTGTGWVSAGSVPQRSTGVAEEVPDQGDVWVFRFDSQGETGGELRLGRAELEAADWKITVPAEVGRRLAEAGAPPTP